MYGFTFVNISVCNLKNRDIKKIHQLKKLVNPYHYHLIILSEDTFKVRRKGASRDDHNQCRIKGTEVSKDRYLPRQGGACVRGCQCGEKRGCVCVNCQLKE